MSEQPSRYSQCGRILRILEDGEWHSAREIFRRLPEGATLHSRIAELRKPGHGKWSYEVQHETRGPGAAGSFYRLALSETGGVQPTSAVGREPVGETQACTPVSESTMLPEGDDAIVGGITRSPSGSIGAATGALLESAQDSPLPAGRSAPQPASPQLSLPLSGRLREEAA